MLIVVFVFMIINLKISEIGFESSKIISKAWHVLGHTEYVVTFLLFFDQIIKRKQVLEFLECVHAFDTEVFGISLGLIAEMI